MSSWPCHDYITNQILPNSRCYREYYSQCSSQQTQTICITFVQRRPNVFDVGPTLYKCYTNVCWDITYYAHIIPSYPMDTAGHVATWYGLIIELGFYITL